MENKTNESFGVALSQLKEACDAFLSKAGKLKGQKKDKLNTKITNIEGLLSLLSSVETTSAPDGNSMNFEEDNVTWFDKLVALKKLDRYIKEYYYDATEMYKNILPLTNHYKQATEEKKVSQDNVDKIFKYIKDKTPAKDIAQRLPYISEDEVQEILDFYAGKDANYLKTALKDAQACITRYELSDQWTEDIKDIDELGKHYIDVINPNRAVLLTKQEDLDHMDTWTNAVQAFLDAFTNSKDEVLKKYFQANYDNLKNFPVVIAENKTGLEKALLDADKRRAEHAKLKSLSEEEQIEANPDLVNEDSKYKTKRKNPKKEDKRNQRFLKKQGMYHKKEGYDMYDQGDGDEDEVDLNDIIQGALGDCFLLSAMAAVARANPSLIKKIISFKPKDDFATVTLHMKKADGTRVKKEVKVDFYFPVQKFADKFAYAKGGDGELWVLVIEKAYAKEMGGYDIIHKGGDAGEALAVLTGKEAERVALADDDQALGQAIENAVAEDKSAVAGTKTSTEIPSSKYRVEPMNANDPDTGYYVVLSDKDHLVCKHAYTIVSVDKNNKTITLRNPHGMNVVERRVEGVTKRDTIGAKLTITFEEFRDCFVDFCVADLK